MAECGVPVRRARGDCRRRAPNSWRCVGIRGWEAAPTTLVKYALAGDFETKVQSLHRVCKRSGGYQIDAGPGDLDDGILRDAA